MDNLEKLTVWVNRKHSQETRNLRGYAKFVESRIANFEKDFPDMDFPEKIEQYTTFDSDISNLSMNATKIEALEKIIVSIKENKDSDTVLSDLKFQREVYSNSLKDVLESFKPQSSEKLKSCSLRGSDTVGLLKYVNEVIKTLDLAINILEGTIDIRVERKN